MTRQYWLDLFTVKTWEEFLMNGAAVTGFRERRLNTAKRIRPGDYFICYLTRQSKLLGVLEALSGYYFDDKTRIWEDTIFPVRFKVRPVYQLDLKTAIPILSLKDRLSIFENLKSPKRWSGFFRGSPAKFTPEDGEVIVSAIEEAAKHRTANEQERIKEPKLEYVAVAKVKEEKIHDTLKRQIKELGEILGRYAKEEYASPPYLYDVVWKEIEGLPRPSHVFEVQDKGAVDSALAKLQHARDMWRPRLFLVVTGERDRRKVDMLLEPFLRGTFHGIRRDTTVLTAETIAQIHQALSTHRELVKQFLEI